MPSLVWFRNDLRTHDNTALDRCIKDTLAYRSSDNSNNESCTAASLKQQVLAIVFISEHQWQNHNWSPIKVDLYKRHVHFLKKNLSAIGITLHVVNANTFQDQINQLSEFVKNKQISSIYANSEPEINEVFRDQACHDIGLPLTLFESDVIVEKGKVLNKSGDMFKVFTPFKKAWVERVRALGFEYVGKPEIYNDLTGSESPTYKSNIPYENSETTETVVNATALNESDSSESLSSAWPLVDVVESHVIPSFLSEKLVDYSHNRDIPSIKGTSGLSPYLAIGALSPRYLLVLLLNRTPDLLDDIKNERFTWLNELIWRDFYRHLIFHFPNLCKHQSFNNKYSTTQWPNNTSLFEAWCEGRTGYPIVDAAMLQLNTTGWMHNRLRMIVASFLTKHLLIDWRWGEKYFMTRLIDGDLAANNGGWQWAASTGCDAQPYFRIFNPMLQSKKFDPDGEFIRKYLPELKDVPNKEIHFPHQYIEAQALDIYWPAIVEHKQARLMALEFYK